MSALTGAVPLLRTSLKHEGRNFAPWIVIATALSVSSVLVYPLVFPDQAERAGLAAAVGANPALGLIFGPAFDLSTTDGFNSWRSLALGGFLVALGAIFTVVKTTRGQEDSGQAELLASAVLGRATRLLTGAGLALAFALQACRDFGQGAIPPRPGPARGKVRSTWRLALRLNVGPMLTWALAFVVLGYFTTSIQDILGKDSAVSQILAAGAATPDQLVSAFIVTILSLVGILASIPGVQTMLRVRSEETDDRVEPLLAGAITRSCYYGSNAAVALLAPAVYVLIAGLVIAALASNADVGVNFGDAARQALAMIPAVWTVVAVSVAVIGARPAVPLAAWVGVLGSFALTLLGPTFKLWDGVLAISPFWHIPNVTDSDANWWGPVWISLVTAVLLLVGFTGFRRRDLARR